MTSKFDSIKQRCDAATPGPWETIGKLSVDIAAPHSRYGNQTMAWSVMPEDREFIAHTRTDIPLLLKALELCATEMNASAKTKWLEENDADEIDWSDYDPDYWIKQAEKASDK